MTRTPEAGAKPEPTPGCTRGSGRTRPASNSDRPERAFVGSLLARVVLERDPETDAVIEDPAILDRQVLPHDLCDAQLAYALSCSLDCDSSGGLPRLRADAHDLGDAINALR